MDYATTSGRYPRVTQLPLFYARQLVTPAELNLETSYFLDRLRRHNRMLHGWGVLCGALVCRVVDPDGTAQPWKVKITPGHLIDPYGNEIAILTERVVDLRAGGLTASGDDPAGELSDPWCREAWVEPSAGTHVVAVKYHQGKARPVRVQPSGCSCDDTSCEYSRWCDGYQVGVLDQCPPSHLGDPPPLDTLVGTGPVPECPPEPDDPWVALAEVDLDGDGRITRIDNCHCRRMIVSLAHLWRRCRATRPTITKATVEVEGKATTEVARGQSGITVRVKGTDIDPAATAELGQGMRATATEVADDGTAMTVTVSVLDTAKTGPRDLTVTNPECAIATSEGVLTVSGATAAPSSGRTQPAKRRTRRPS